MSIPLEDLCKLMHDTYETAALKHGWYDHTHVRIPWAFIPDENKESMRDAVATLERAIREDERAKDNPESMQADLKQIMEALSINTHIQPYSPHTMVQSEILPKIRKMKKTLVDVRAELERILRNTL